MVVGRAELGVDVWAPGVEPLSRVWWPKLELMLGRKGRLRERFVVDMVSILGNDCTFRSVADYF